MKTLLVLSLLAVSLTAHALPRTGGAYTLTPETTNAGGSRTSSASYSHEGSLGDIGGFASVASPSVTVLSGYIGAQDVVGLVPGVITAPVTNLTATGATLSGEVTSEGGSAVTARGFVVGTSPDPTVENDDLVPAGSGMGSFTVPVTDLLPGTTYHLRAYATSEIGTGYGANIVFTTDTNVTFTNGLAPFARDILPGGRQVFHFSVGGPRIVSLVATGGAFLRAELFDDEGNLIASFNGDSDFDLEQLLLAGDYTFHVFRQDDMGTSQSFALEIDASVVAASRPDLAVGASAARLQGIGIYAPASQSAALISKKAKAVTAYAGLSNRGNLPDVLVGSATAGSRLFAVSYFDPAGNITAGLLTGTYTTPEMDENAAPVVIRATITPNKKKLTKKKGKKTMILKKTHLLSLRLSSTFDPSTVDAATIRVQTKGSGLKAPSDATGETGGSPSGGISPRLP
jgi:hypothetical protein